LGRFFCANLDQWRFLRIFLFRLRGILEFRQGTLNKPDGQDRSPGVDRHVVRLPVGGFDAARLVLECLLAYLFPGLRVERDAHIVAGKGVSLSMRASVGCLVQCIAEDG
jgi:hypothetical protein